jgi:hypothetical protein
MNDTLIRNCQRPFEQRTGLWLFYSRPKDRPGTVRSHQLQRGATATIGSGPLADVRLPDRFVSRSHLRVDWRRGEAFMEDLASTNGTAVNGLPLSGRRRLETPSLVRIGQLEIVLLDACLQGGALAVSLGPICGPAGPLLPHLYRFVLGTLELGPAGDFYRQAVAALCLGREGGYVTPVGLLRMLAPQAALAIGGAHG